ncbi:Las17-binding protein actin regulator [Paraburkholderia sp. BL23I1N1]|uniref:lipid-binding SYLF domain-containing protein n=1 Tax=Paraburkholderia sp. BL23I1N1 TaxID=1938802 RepID=UPI000E76F00D|nr:lipid-binding SYLF domain-containing protein [Paraburkholderia sp. BL23I1N1]RKE39464.1 Las17-binding protein actin regulator [Paraburkholderia sp. BL23I1N1]
MIRFVCVLGMVSCCAVLAACSTGQSSSGQASPAQSSSAEASATPMAMDPGLDEEANAALRSLYSDNQKAQEIGQRAKGILVFPDIVKAGFLVGAHHGEGELIENGKVTGYYAHSAVSYGLQAGVQKFSYAMFFMSDSALQNLKTSPGFEVGVGPSIVVVDAGKAKSLTTATMQADIYAFIFDQKGLMAGLGLQGSKITRLSR